MIDIPILNLYYKNGDENEKKGCYLFIKSNDRKCKIS